MREQSEVCEPGPALKLFQANNVHLIRWGCCWAINQEWMCLFLPPIWSYLETSWHLRISQPAMSRQPDEQQQYIVLAWHTCVSYDVLIAEDQVMVVLYYSPLLGK